ncbi:hypothetical protein BFG60_0040 [Microcystis aeruginosa NIES-98]|nr:hypothetical protein BFG60_0040 [Microcystis aeruginosa NIES-98]
MTGTAAGPVAWGPWGAQPVTIRETAIDEPIALDTLTDRLIIVKFREFWQKKC